MARTKPAEHSIPYKVGLIHTVQRLFEAVVKHFVVSSTAYTADKIFIFVSRLVRYVNGLNKRSTILISPRLTMKRGTRLVNFFLL